LGSEWKTQEDEPMSNETAELRNEIETLKTENEKMRAELTQTKKLRDQYSRELLLAFPPPDYTDEEIANFINNRVPAAAALRELREKYGDRDS
jgi:uncharacterized coiled-coil DUF342 family protein